MTTVEVHGSSIAVNGVTIEVGAPVLCAAATKKIVLVLIDPDSYLNDPNYRKSRRAGSPAVRNLRAFSPDGAMLWEAEMPELADYYYRIVSLDPIEVDSFSGYRCEIDWQTGCIVSKRFMK